jgi:hypothetical protein
MCGYQTDEDEVLVEYCAYWMEGILLVIFSFTFCPEQTPKALSQPNKAIFALVAAMTKLNFSSSKVP